MTKFTLKIKFKIIDETIANQEALAAIEANYQEKVSMADAFFELQNWEEALAAYAQALQFKAEESYPIRKMAEIREIQTQLEAKRTLALKIEQLITKLEAAFEAKQYDEAIETADEIIRLDAENPTAKSRKAAVELAKEAIARENEQRYLMAMQQGETLIQQKEYQDAIVSFKIALGLKKNDANAQQRIKQVESLLEERLLALKTAYNAHIADADRHFNAGTFDMAIESYLKAEGTKPDMLC